MASEVDGIPVWLKLLYDDRFVLKLSIVRFLQAVFYQHSLVGFLGCCLLPQCVLPFGCPTVLVLFE